MDSSTKQPKTTSFSPPPPIDRAAPARTTREYRSGETQGEAGIDVPDHQAEQAENMHHNRQQEPVPCSDLP